jgi:hypothetical protein
MQKMSTGTFTVYKYVKEHYPISAGHRGAHEHQFKNPCYTALILQHKKYVQESDSENKTQ